jgi:hypothetical protein
VQVVQFALCKGISMCMDLCSIEKLARCLDLVLEGGFGAQCADLLSYVKLDSVV